VKRNGTKFTMCEVRNENAKLEPIRFAV